MSFYHVYNRGVDKQRVFIDDQDRERFMRCMRRFLHKDGQKLLNLHAYCLMDNHFHFLFEELSENGISILMHKIGTAYTRYFNKRYARSGSLFEARYKRKIVHRDGYLLHLFRYIHLNPLKFISKKWKDGGLDVENAIRFVRDYKWGSLNSVFRESDICSHDILESQFRDYSEYQRFLEDWIRFGAPLDFS